MKMVKNILFAAVILIFSACSSTKTSSSPDRINEVINKVLSRNYTITVNYAYPLRGKQVYLADGYELIVRNDSAIAYLPYYGRVHNAPLNPLEGRIKFAEPLAAYQVNTTKRGDGWDISFKVNSREYQYDFQLSIFINGTSSFTANSVERDPITFSGTLKGLTTQK